MNESIMQDQQVQVVQGKVPSLITEAKAIQIDSELKAKHANDLKLASKKMFNIAEERRKFFVKPLQDHVKTINDEFKKLTQPLEEVEEILKDKLLGWIRAIQAKEAEESRIRQEKEREENKLKEATINEFLGPEEAPVIIADKPIIIDEKPKVILDSGLGKTFTRKVWKWKVLDESKIPDDYYQLDEKMIDTLLRAHIKTVKGVSTNDLVISGIEIYQEIDLSSRN